ncbi:hypothetical protein M422DRAFT_207487 [Sphaerobolus stellatus SS14]|uniref:Vacuolar protein sorting-associated protein 27 n=1 Tax=Sphaerobolus stellatus (strain SS14) TaxID=990650 RepID=A0A0C9W2E8_SPHS4|nr:hypothetical protein M422DRAFT_207487 [Sphaerobolus stellatus SS14]
MSLSSLIWGQSQFDEAIDKATSELRLGEEDIALNLEICDQIRSKSVPAKEAIRALKRRMNNKNPNVQLLTLGLTDICVKNGGDHFLNEVASREFMDNLVSILKMPGLNIDVKTKLLRLIQNWSIAFEGKYTLGYVGQVYKELKSEGFNFPPKDLTAASSAMIDTATAPEWIDSDVCLRCRTAFSFTNRKHHCRNCGRVFDQTCSAKSMPLPHFGITQEVRVCDGCHAKLSKATRDKERSKSVDFSKVIGHHSSSRSRKHQSATNFDTDLQRAIQLSLAESGSSTHTQSSYDPWQTSEPPLVDRATRPGAKREEDEDPELRAAIEASLREASAPKPSAPIASPYEEREEYSYRGASSYASDRNLATPQPPLPQLPNHDLDPRESDAILMFNQTVQDAQAQGGSDLSRMANVHELYDRANSLRPKLALGLDDTGRKEEMLSGMHKKLSEAVRLYDQLLSQQISRPTWRTAPTSQQAYGQTYSQPPPINEAHRPNRQEWSNQQAAGSPAPVQQNYATYNAVPPPVPSSSRPAPQRQTSYAEYNGPNAYAQPPMPSTASEPPRQPYAEQPQNWSPASIQAPVQQYAPQTAVSASPPPPEQWRPEAYHSIHGALSQPGPPVTQGYPQQLPVAPPSVGSQSPIAPTPQSYAPIQSPIPPTPQSYAPVQSPPPQQSQQPYQSPPVHSPAPVAQQQYTPNLPILQSPPPQAQQAYQPVAPAATVSRHNTVSHASYAGIPQQASLARSNTVSGYAQPQNGYVHATPAPSNALPSFPTVPKAEPAVYYPPPAFEQTEKKEALLIDL